MSKHSKIIRNLAELAFDTPSFAGAKVVAALYLDGELISMGINHRKSHPLMRRFGKNKNAIYLHAEIDAIRKALNILDVRKLTKSVLYVCRVTKNKEVAMSKPCIGCQKAIVAFDIQGVYYSIDDFVISNGDSLNEV